MYVANAQNAEHNTAAMQNATRQQTEASLSEIPSLSVTAGKCKNRLNLNATQIKCIMH